MKIVQVGGQKMWRFVFCQVWSEVHSLTVDMCKFVTKLITMRSLCVFLGPKATMNGITAEHQKKVLAAFLEKCPEQYTM